MKIIIGASGGIGSKLFKHYSKTEKVLGTYFNNGKDGLVKLDIRAPYDVKDFFSRIDLEDEVCLINCAGINYDRFAHHALPYHWHEVIDLNLNGVFNAISSILPHMREKHYGRIINMGSMVAQVGIPGTSAYAASKSAIWGMTKAIACENRDLNVTINTLNLGYMAAGMGLDFPEQLWGGINNIINAIDFLVDSEFVTGTSIDINGGFI